MNCQSFEDRLDDFLDGRMAAGDLLAAEEHRARCPACASLAETVRLDLEALAPGELQAGEGRADAGGAGAGDLAARVVARTSGSGCGRAQQQLCDLADGALESADAEIVRLHLDHCRRCSALHATLLWLGRELPLLAEIEPDAQLAADVLQATARLRRRRRTPIAHLKSWWQRLLERPRFAWEAAYAGTVLVVLLFGMPSSPFHEVPSQALAFIRIEPVAAVNGTARRLLDLHQAIGDLGHATWDATGGRVVARGEAWGEGYAGRHPGLAESKSALRQHGGAIRQSISRRDFASTSLLVNALGHDLAAAWRSATRPAAADSTPP